MIDSRYTFKIFGVQVLMMLLSTAMLVIARTSVVEAVVTNSRCKSMNLSLCSLCFQPQSSPGINVRVHQLERAEDPSSKPNRARFV